MAQSRPAQATPAGPPRGARGPLVNAVAGLTLRSLPRIPDRVKRLLLGGHSITVDGNTLDPTLQVMLTGMKAVGLGGLVASPDVGVAREQLRILAASFKQDIPVASVTNLSLPGSGGPIRARHYRPTSAGPQPLLVFYHGGGQVIVSHPAGIPRPHSILVRVGRIAGALAHSDWRVEAGDLVSDNRERNASFSFVHAFEPGELEREATAAGLRSVFRRDADDRTVVCVFART